MAHSETLAAIVRDLSGQEEGTRQFAEYIGRPDATIRDAIEIIDALKIKCNSLKIEVDEAATNFALRIVKANSLLQSAGMETIPFELPRPEGNTSLIRAAQCAALFYFVENVTDGDRGKWLDLRGWRQSGERTWTDPSDGKTQHVFMGACAVQQRRDMNEVRPILEQMRSARP